MRKLLQKVLIKIFPELYKLKSPEYDFTALRSWKENVTLGKQVSIKPICQIYNTNIGDYSYSSNNSFVNDVSIGKFCSIGHNFFCGWGIHPTNGISTAPMFYSANKPNGITLSSSDKVQEYKRITIGNDAFLGAYVTILDSAVIGAL